MIRELYFSEEFWEFYHLQETRVQEKFDYVLSVVRSEKVISTKFVKHLETTDLYEMRVSVGNNEYRTILFAIDHDNIIASTKIIVLNAFIKKSTKDYKKQIKVANEILRRYEDEKIK